MVVFICGNCGDSVKKPAVLKHQVKCKSTIALICMDCLKDFDEETFKTHNVCISEEQRYSGKDYIPKESSNKGAKKQAIWIDIVRSILNDPSEYKIDQDLKQILLRIQGCDNIPRKKVKFENFISKSLRIPRSKAEAIWKLLEKGLQKLKQKTQEDMKKNAKKNGSTNEDKRTDLDANPLSSNGNVKNEEKKVKNGDGKEKGDGKIKSKKRKIPEENDDDASVTATTVESAKKKKKKKRDYIGQWEVTDILPSNGVNQERKIKTEKEDAETENDAFTFDWKAIIFDVVNSTPNGIQIDNLKNRVLKKYQSIYNVDKLPHKIERIFYKKLKQIPSFVNQSDIIRLIKKEPMN